MQTIKMWACFDPEGEIIAHTLSNIPHEARIKIVQDCLYWGDYKKQGYTCLQVEVSITKIK